MSIFVVLAATLNKGGFPPIIFVHLESGLLPIFESQRTHSDAAVPANDGPIDPIDRILSRSKERGSHSTESTGSDEIFTEERFDTFLDDGSDVLDDDDGSDYQAVFNFDLEERQALRRVRGLSTELEDVTEVENRQLRVEQVIVIGVYPQGALVDAENSLRELAALCDTAGATVLDGLLQRRPYPDPTSYFGKGKAQELRDLAQTLEADTIVVDTELAPSQRRELEDIVKIKVIDRTAVILDIFSQHAKSREGKAQVELAQLEYLLPRLRGWGMSMSRQAGGQVGSGVGMGSRGPGETKIELDRRRIYSRISALKKQIAGFAPTREAKRATRRKNRVPTVSIVGYTNAGKSSLMNRITDAGLLVENQLFATLDPTVRKHETADGVAYTLVDTVGFVRSLPHQLVEAFRSTLEEIEGSDLILHVVDASHPDPQAQIQAVREVLADLELKDAVEVIVFNKIDLLEEESFLLLQAIAPGSVFVSSRTGRGMDELLERISTELPKPDFPVRLLIPYQDGAVVNRLHEEGIVQSVEHGEKGSLIDALVPKHMLPQLSEYLVRDI